jgi:hypothetical protein
MTKQCYLLFTGVLLLLSGATQAQKSNETISDKAIQYAVKTEITDVAGKIHKGRLLYADSSSIFVLSDKGKESTILQFDAEQVMKLHVRKTHRFGRRFGNATALSAGLFSIVLLDAYTKGDAIMVGPGAILLIGTTIIGVPAAFITAVVNIPQTNIKYLTKGKQEEYQKVVPYISQNGILKRQPDSAVMHKAEYNEQALWGLQEPLIDKSPESSLPFHFNLNTSLSYMSFSQKITDETNYGFTEEMKHNNLGSRLNIKISFNLNNKLRPFIDLPAKQNFSFAQFNSQGHQLAFWYKNFQIAAGTDYYFKTVNRMFFNRFEYSAGMGLAASYLTFNTVYYFNNEEYNILENQHHILYGLHLNTSAAYYIAPHVSLTAGVSSNILWSGSYKNLNYKVSNSDIITINSLKSHAFDLSFGLGLSVHI